MRYYETLYIINPNFEQERINRVLDKVSQEVNKLKYKIINHRVWGKKRLAFPIEKHKYGTYMILHFEMEDYSRLAELQTFMNLNKTILRSQTVCLDKKPEVYIEKTVVEDSKEDLTYKTDKEADIEDESIKPEESENEPSPAEEVSSEDQQENEQLEPEIE